MAFLERKFCQKKRTVQQSQSDIPNPNTAESTVEKRAPHRCKGEATNSVF